MHIAVVSHALVQQPSRARWRRLAARDAVAVTLLVPDLWRNRWFGNRVEWVPEPVQEDSYRVIPVPVTNHEDWGRYLIRSVDAELRALKPDVVIVYSDEFSLVLHQLLVYRRLWAPRARVGYFSWQNLTILGGRHRLLKRMIWRHTVAATDFAIAGNQDARSLMRQAGYRKPILVQTELGFDGTRCQPDARSRVSIRRELGIDEFTVGYVGRLTEAKGVDDLIDAARQLAGPATLLLVGDGDSREALEEKARAGGCNAHFTGQVDPDRIPGFLNAMDCLVLPSRTAATWKEQFGLVLAEAMACAVPVIGSDSGAIPEVIGDAGIVFPEGDVDALKRALETVRTDEQRRTQLAARSLERATSRFSAVALAAELHEWLVGQVVSG